MRRMLLAVAAGAVVLVGVTAAWYVGQPLESMPVPTAAPVQQPVVTVLDEVTVYVSGEVAAPGLVSVPTGGRIADAIAEAGGATSDAALSSLNLASIVSDGQQIVVPDRVGAITAEGGAHSPADDGLVHVNEATVDELQGLPGVGPVLAARIVEYRDSVGPFATVEDLLDVPGIGEGKLATLRDSVAIP